MGRSDQGYGNPTIYVAAYLRVGLFPYCREADGYAVNHSLRLHSEETFHHDDKGGEVAAFWRQDSR